MALNRDNDSCWKMPCRICNQEGRQIIGCGSNAPDRFGDAKKLLEWGFDKLRL